MKKILIILIVSVLFLGCPSKDPDSDNYNDTKAENMQDIPSDEDSIKIKYERWSKKIGGQFWPFSLKEYELQEEDADIVSSLGGRWITVRYLLRDGSHIAREEMVQRITSSFESYGWKQAALPKGKYVLSVIYEMSNNDLHFVRGPFTLNDSVLGYKITIHISDDAAVLVLYCEAIW